MQTATQSKSTKKNIEKNVAAKDRFSVPQAVLSSILTSMQPICGRRTVVPATESVLFQITPRELVIKSTDLDVSLQASVPLETGPEDKIEFLIHGKRLFELVRELSGNLDFLWDGKAIAIQTGDALGISLSTSEVGDFPPFPERIENLMDLDADFLGSVLDRLAPLVPQNNANPALNGMLVECTKEGISFVATDGHSLARLTSTSYTMEEPQTWILPKRAVLELKKTLDVARASRVFLGTCNGQLVFSGGNFNFFTRLVADKFPAYAPILERSGFQTGTINRDIFMAALRRAGCLLAGRFVSTKFSFENKVLTLSVNNKEVGSITERVALDSFGTVAVSTRFYSPYVLAAAQAAGTSMITFSVKEGSSPIFFEAASESSSLVYLVMPVLDTKE